MRFAYADPPYIGKARKHYGPDAREVNHELLIAHLVDEFPDGWALSCNSTTLQYLLSLCPPGVRISPWTKTFAVFKKGVNPAYAWEPVIWTGGRPASEREQPMAGGPLVSVRDWVSGPITLGRGTVGAKPDFFCAWLFDLLGMRPDDELVDIFPGSGAVGEAWERFSMSLEREAVSHG